MVLAVTCFSAKFFVLVVPYARFHILDNRVAAYWEKVAHSAYDMFLSISTLVLI